MSDICKILLSTMKSLVITSGVVIIVIIIAVFIFLMTILLM